MQPPNANPADGGAGGDAGDFDNPSMPPETLDSAENTLSPGLAAALSYAARGWHVFPCFGDPADPRDKSPVGKKCKAPLGALVRHGLRDATTDPEVIRRWWTAEPTANIGIATGPSGLCVCDIDSAAGELAIKHCGGLPDSLEVKTGKGRHVYMTGQSTSVNRALDGVDRKSLGGYVIAPPSRHESGRVYEWSDPDVAVAPAPAWFIECGRRQEAKPEQETKPGKFAEGKRNDYLSRKAYGMRKLGFTPEQIIPSLQAMNQEECRPPLERNEVEAIARGKAGIASLADHTEFKSPTVRTLRERLEAQRNAGPRVPTGVEPLDVHLRGGLRAEELLVLGGAPGAGKTTLLLQISRHLAAFGVAVGILAADEGAAGLDARNLQSVGITRDEAEQPTPETIERAVQALGHLPMMTFEDGTVEDAFALLAEAHPNKPRCIMLDSLQTVRTRQTSEIDAIRERIDDVVRTAKRLARQPETRAIVIATSELARGAYRSRHIADAVNDLAAFKESGGIEYGVHTALVLRAVDALTVHASLPKNRLGTRGDFSLQLNTSTATFKPAPLFATGGIDGAQRQAAHRAKVADALHAVQEAGASGISGNRVCAKVGGRKADALAALDELRGAGVITRQNDRGPWRLAEGWEAKWAELQDSWG